MIYKIGKPRKFAVYVDKYPYKKPVQIFNELGCDLLINGQFFNMTTREPCQNLKQDGVTLSYEYILDGYGWNPGDTRMRLTPNLDKYANFISCIPMIKNGEPVDLDYPKETAGSRPRNAIGFTETGEFIALVCRQSETYTMEQLQSLMIAQRCEDSIALDGGQSCCLISRELVIEAPRWPLVIYLAVWGDQRTVIDPNAKTLYRVQVGAFKDKWRAENLQAQIRALPDPLLAGYKNAQVRLIDNLYKVQVGAFSEKWRAEKVKEDLKKHGIESFIT